MRRAGVEDWMERATQAKMALGGLRRDDNRWSTKITEWRKEVAEMDGNTDAGSMTWTAISWTRVRG